MPCMQNHKSYDKKKKKLYIRNETSSVQNVAAFR